MVDVGAVLVDIVADGGGGAAPAAAPAAAAAPAPAAAPAAGAGKRRDASGAAHRPGGGHRRRVHRRDGPRGRVLKGDALAAAARTGGGAFVPTNAGTAAPARRPAPGGAGGAGAGAAPIRGVRRLMFDSMAASLAVPHFVYADEFGAGAGGAALGYSAALLDQGLQRRAAPLPGGQRVDRRGRGRAARARGAREPRVGLAMDTPQGLVVPVVRDVGNKSIGDVAAELARLRDAARAGGLAPGDVAPTFTPRTSAPSAAPT
ncbi:dihydrolipoamide acetyltransferase [Aureococcus anophagefferens]|nr:dihydrolipoamide acetyltransferase [Aureococcus anophagefferens]